MRRTALLVILAVALLGGGCGNTENAPESAEGSPRSEVRDKSPSAPEDPAPEFAVTTFTGDRFALAEQKGTPVVLNFWESW